MSASAESLATGIGPDYDAFDLTATVSSAYNSSSPTSTVFPLLYEGIGSSVVPPVGFFVPSPPNFRLSLDWVNFVNTSTSAATVSLQIYEYSGNPQSPYGEAGPVVFTETLAAGASLPVDGTRFRISAAEGFFLVAFSTVAGVIVQARGRFTPG